MIKPQYLTEQEVAKMTSLSLSKLRSDRHLSTGFNYHKLGKAVRYSLEHIMEHMAQHQIINNKG